MDNGDAVGERGREGDSVSAIVRSPVWTWHSTPLPWVRPRVVAVGVFDYVGGKGQGVIVTSSLRPIALGFCGDRSKRREAPPWPLHRSRLRPPVS